MFGEAITLHTVEKCRDQPLIPSMSAADSSSSQKMSCSRPLSLACIGETSSSDRRPGTCEVWASQIRSRLIVSDGSVIRQPRRASGKKKGKGGALVSLNESF